MSFKVGDQRAMEREIKGAPANLAVRTQCQVGLVGDETKLPKAFQLSWRLEYGPDDSVQSDWTPQTTPSISKTIGKRGPAKHLVILGNNIHGNFSLELARIIFVDVINFGYIGEQTLSGTSDIIGMYVNLLGNRTIKIYRTGMVREVLK